jgi:hypothetical protein
VQYPTYLPPPPSPKTPNPHETGWPAKMTATTTTFPAHPTMTEHDWRFPRRPGLAHVGLDSLSFDLPSTYGAAYDKLAYGAAAGAGATVPGFQHNGAADIEGLDPILARVWRFFAFTRLMLPDQRRMENMSWRIGSMRLHQMCAQTQASVCRFPCGWTLMERRRGCNRDWAMPVVSVTPSLCWCRVVESSRVDFFWMQLTRRSFRLKRDASDPSRMLSSIDADDSMNIDGPDTDERKPSCKKDSATPTSSLPPSYMSSVPSPLSPTIPDRPPKKTRNANRAISKSSLKPMHTPALGEVQVQPPKQALASSHESRKKATQQRQQRQQVGGGGSGSGQQPHYPISSAPARQPNTGSGAAAAATTTTTTATPGDDSNGSNTVEVSQRARRQVAALSLSFLHRDLCFFCLGLLIVRRFFPLTPSFSVDPFVAHYPLVQSFHQIPSTLHTSIRACTCMYLVVVAAAAAAAVVTSGNRPMHRSCRDSCNLYPHHPVHTCPTLMPRIVLPTPPALPRVLGRLHLFFVLKLYARFK